MFDGDIITIEYEYTFARLSTICIANVRSVEM